MATFYHGTTQRSAECIEAEGFLGSELSTFTSGFASKDFENGVVFLAKEKELALGYGDTLIEVHIDESLVSEYQECPITGLREYFAKLSDMIEDAAWWINE